MRALTLFRGCTELWVPDNLRSGVTTSSRCEPDVDHTYHGLAEHYGAAVLPARARRPKDTAKVQNGLLVVTRWILAGLPHQRFFRLNELNRPLRKLLTDLNQWPFKRLTGSRASAFAEMDQPALRALPEQHYEYADWKVALAGVDYHVEVDGHYYSVPCQHARAQVNVGVTRSTVEVFQRGQSIASQAQCTFEGRHTTVAARMPTAHREVANSSLDRLTARAATVGPRCWVPLKRLLCKRLPHPIAVTWICCRCGKNTAMRARSCVRALKSETVRSGEQSMLNLKHLSFEEHRGLRVEPDNVRSGGSNASRPSRTSTRTTATWPPSCRLEASHHASIADFRIAACLDCLDSGRADDWFQDCPCWHFPYCYCCLLAQFSCSFRPPLKVGHSRVAVAGPAKRRRPAARPQWRRRGELDYVAHLWLSKPFESLGYC